MRQSGDQRHSYAGDNQQDRWGRVQPLRRDRDRGQDRQHEQHRFHDFSHDKALAGQIRLETMFTVKANTATLKKNANAPWSVTMRRMTLLVITTSETWEVIAMTREK